MSCAGTGADTLWDRLLDVTAPASRSVAPFATDHLGGPKEIRRLDLFALYALCAADEAWRQAGLPAKLADAASIISTGIGGLHTTLEQVEVLRERGAYRVSPFFIPMLMPNAAAAAVSMRFGTDGPCQTVTTACAAGTHAVGHGARLVATGRCAVAVVGGAEAVMLEIAEAGFTNITALSASGVSRPFDEDRDGFVLGEGGGVLVLETSSTPRHGAPRSRREWSARRPRPTRTTSPRPSPVDGARAPACNSRSRTPNCRRRTSSAHQRARHVHPAQRPRRGDRRPRALRSTPSATVTSVKGYLGHSLAAAGAIEAVVSVLTVAAP